MKRILNYWEKIYKYPQFGISLFYSTLGNKNVFGDEIALYPYFSILSHPNKKLHIENRLGLGLAYATRKFELSDNYENVAVGSHLNVHFRYHLGLQYDISPNLRVKTGINFHHFSNANMREPNLGLNMVSLSLGVSKALGKQEVRLTPETPTFHKSNQFLAILSFGGKHTRALQSDVFPTVSVAFEANRKLSHTFHFGTGIDVFYDASTKTEMPMDEQINFKPIDNFRTGIHISQALVYNKFSFILQEGLYLGLKDKVNQKLMYNKLILRYKFAPKFVAQLAVKSHLHILDFPECGFSYCF